MSIINALFIHMKLLKKNSEFFFKKKKEYWEWTLPLFLTSEEILSDFPIKYIVVYWFVTYNHYCIRYSSSIFSFFRDSFIKWWDFCYYLLCIYCDKNSIWILNSYLCLWCWTERKSTWSWCVIFIMCYWIQVEIHWLRILHLGISKKLFYNIHFLMYLFFISW